MAPIKALQRTATFTLHSKAGGRVGVATASSTDMHGEGFEIMESIWTRSKWTKQQLEHKTVEFRIRTSRGIEQGIGEFWVRQNPAGLLAIDVVTNVQGQDWLQRIQTRRFLSQIAVDRIERHADQSVAEFRLVWGHIELPHTACTSPR